MFFYITNVCLRIKNIYIAQDILLDWPFIVKYIGCFFLIFLHHMTNSKGEDDMGDTQMKF